jgi:hypothetical protein
MNVSLSDKSKQFLCDEWNKADRTIVILRENLDEPSPWSPQYLISSGTLLGDIYKAVENSLRTLIEEIDGNRLLKNDRWHQTLLEKSYEYGLILDENYKTIRSMLSYRHRFIHGYDVELDEKYIREGATEAIEAFCEFVNHIRTKFDIP